MEWVLSGAQSEPSTPHKAYPHRGPSLVNCPEPHSSSSGSESNANEANGQILAAILYQGGEFEYQARKDAD